MAKRKTEKKSKKNPNAKVKTSSKFSLKKLLPLGLLATVLGFLLYVNTFQHEWALDDFSVIKENWVTQQGFGGIGTHLTNSYRYGYGAGFGTLYRPLSPVMFAMEWGISPDNPGFMHFVNALFYALTGFLLFFTLSRVLKNYNVFLPFAATILFMVHPLHTESVANIKGRDDIMGFFLFLLAIYWLWNYLEKSDWKWLGLSLVSFFLANLAKESSVTFVAVIPLMLYYFTKIPNEKIIKTSGMFLGVALLFILIRWQVLGNVKGVVNTSALDNVLESTDSFLDQKATAFVVLGRYFKLLFFPHPLVSDAGFNQIPIVSFSDWRAILSFLIHAGLGVYALLQIPKKTILSFSILFYILTFSVTSNVFFNIGTGYAERLLYVPVLGFTMALSYGVMRLFKIEMKRGSKFDTASFFKKNTMPLVVITVLAVAYSAKTVDRNMDWKDSFTLYDTDVLVSPECAKLQYHYGLELSKRGLELNGQAQSEMMNKAKTTFEKATQIYPQYHDAFAQLGLWHYRAGFKDKAIEFYNKAIEFKPNNAKAYNNLGIIYFERNATLAAQGNAAAAKIQMDKAKEVYEKAVLYDPRYVDALRNLGVIYAMRKQFPQAIQYFEKGLQYATQQEQKDVLKKYLNNARQGK